MTGSSGGIGGAMLHLNTIEDMESDAKQQADFSSNKRIRGYWLEVVYVPTENGFTYKWGKNFVGRKEAIEVIKTA